MDSPSAGDFTRCHHCGALLDSAGHPIPSTRENLDRARAMRPPASQRRSKAHYARITKLAAAARARNRAKRQAQADHAAYLAAAWAGKVAWKQTGKRRMERLPKKPTDPC